MGKRKLELQPYHHFSKAEWANFRADEPMTLDASDIQRLRALTDPISLEEAEQVYLPLSRLISLYVEATQQLHHASTRFLGADARKVPYIIGVAGSVASGKSTTSRILQALLRRWPSSPKVDLVTTDGFLHSNAKLDELQLADRKGFPESYDRGALIKFLADIKSGKPNVGVPVYSHLFYDIVEGEQILIDRPDILIVEGLNILQPGELPKSGRPILFASDYLDFSIFIDASEADLTDWFMARFRTLRDTAFADPNSFFHKFSQMSAKEAEDFGMWAWTAINLPNLRDNILPTRSRADLVLTKGPSHAIERVDLRKV
jgi:type I pantothenate kinase